jgi:methyl-accepting chemotaxis protein
MTNERFDNDIPNIVLDKEDREAFQRTRAKDKRKGSTPTEDNTTAEKSGVSGIWLFLVLIIAVSACAASYWLYRHTLVQDAALDNSMNRISELERRLSATGEEMDQSAGALRVTVSELTDKTDELWTQMDKLWASAWRKNQTEIGQLNERFNQASAQNRKQIGILESDVGSVSTNIAILQEKLNQQANELGQLSTLLAEMRTSDTNNARLIGDMQAKVVALDQVNGALNRRVTELEKWRRTIPVSASPTAPDGQ